MSERIDQDLAGNPEPNIRPLSVEEKSQVDSNPDPSEFLKADYWEPTFPASTLERAGVQGTAWLKQYQEKTKTDKLIQFKQKWIHYCVKKSISFAFPFKLTRDRFTAHENRRSVWSCFLSSDYDRPRNDCTVCNHTRREACNP